jgi:hypothetical protein
MQPPRTPEWGAGGIPAFSKAISDLYPFTPLGGNKLGRISCLRKHWKSIYTLLTISWGSGIPYFQKYRSSTYLWNSSEEKGKKHKKIFKLHSMQFYHMCLWLCRSEQIFPKGLEKFSQIDWVVMKECYRERTAIDYNNSWKPLVLQGR